MILDSLLLFTGGSAAPGSNDGKNDAPTTGTQTSSNQLDLGMGLVSNPQIPSFAAGGGARDIGIGDDPALKVLVLVTTLFTGGTNIQIAFQGAPDNGSGQPGSFVTFVSGPVVVEANLIVGARLLDIDVPRGTIPATPAPPRYLQLQYINAGTHGAGKLEGTIVIDRHDQIMQANATLGAYPPGVTVSN
jgi:hypothetical protein